MKKFITPSYVFTPGASGVGTVNLSGITGFNVKNLVSIINQTKGIVIYATGSQSLKYTSVTGTTVTLFADTSSMSAGDTLQVIYEDNTVESVKPILVDKYGNEVNQLATYSGGTAIGNSVHRFRDGFVLAAPDLTVWDQAWTSQGSSFVAKGGDANGSGYLKISMCPYTLDSEYVLTSKETFKFPVVLGFGYSASQRVVGTDFEFGIAGVDANGNIEYIPAQPDTAMPNGFSVSSNVATVTFDDNHPFKGLDRVIIYGNSDNRLNVGPVTVTVVHNKRITFPITLANGSYTTTGFIRFADPLGSVSNSAALVIGDNTVVTSMQLYSRRNGARYRTAAVTTGTSVAATVGSSNFTDTFNSSNNIELIPSPDDVVAVNRAADSVTAPSAPVRFSQGIPDDEKEYKIYIRAKNLSRLPRPIAKIVSISKSGTTTATVTTDVPHGLTTTSRITLYGVLNQTAFPNITATTNPTSIISATQFTVVIGTATTATSSGGRVDSCDGNVTVTGAINVAVQSIQRTDNLMTIICNTNVTGVVQGETIHIYGCTAGSLGLYDGAYLVKQVSGSTIFAESIGPNTSGGLSGGGSILKRTDFRLHFVRLNDYLRTTVEMLSNGASDASKGIPVSGTVAVSSVAGSVNTNTTISSGYLSGIIDPVSVNILSGSIDNIGGTVSTSSLISYNYEDYATGGTFSGGTTISGTWYNELVGCCKFFLDVNSFSGTGRAKVTIQQSAGAGTIWKDLYTFESFNGNAVLTAPVISTRGQTIRIMVVADAGLNFNLSMYVNRSSVAAPINVAQKVFLNSEVNLNTTTAIPSLEIEDCKNVFLTANVVSQSSAATLGIEFSMNNIDWFTGPGTVATVAGVVALKVENQSWAFARIKVVSAGTSVVLKELIIRGVN